MQAAPDTAEELRVTAASNEFAVLLFGAPWSVPSKMMKQKLEQTAVEYGDDVTLVWIDAESKPALAEAYSVEGIPGAVLCRGGAVVKKVENCTANDLLKDIKDRHTWPTTTAVADDSFHQVVADKYAKTVRGEAGCCKSTDSMLNGYTPEMLAAAAGADLGLGCGNPLSFANLRPGETVVDLGSGAGIDCFIAADAVGANGQVIGVDMTPDMLFKARELAKEKVVKNVDFRLGEIEHLPIGDNTVDCVISNCVINLSPDKLQVFREIHRVLRPGGRVAISDVIARKELPQHLKTAEALAC